MEIKVALLPDLVVLYCAESDTMGINIRFLQVDNTMKSAILCLMHEIK